MGMRLLVDISNLIYSSAYKLSLSHKGKKTNIVFGVLRSLEAIAKDLEPSEVVICWDGGSQKRREFFPDYKGNRKKDPDLVKEVERQSAILKGFFDQMPVIQCYEHGVEADDVIAVVSKFLHLEEVGIVTRDSDLFQLVTSPQHHIVDPKSHSVVKLDMKPRQFLTYRVLVGGKDNVNGVLGIGEVKGKKLISQFKTLKRILKHSKKEGGLGRMSHKEVREVVKRNLALWDLSKPQVTEPEKKSILDQYRLGRLSTRLEKNKLQELCLSYGFTSFIRRFTSFCAPFKLMIRGSSSDSGKQGKKGSMGTKDKKSNGWTKRIRKVQGGSTESKAEKESSRAVSQSRPHRVTKGRDKKTNLTTRIRKVTPKGSTPGSRSKSTKGAIRSTQSRSKDGAMVSRSRGIDFSDPRLSKAISDKRRARRAAALLLLSTFAKGEGKEWIEKQTTKKLRWLSNFTGKVTSDENYSPTEKEITALKVLYRDYLGELPAWMKVVREVEE